MKLNEKYGPDEYKLTENVFYTYNQDAFFECLQSPPSIDGSREIYGKDGFSYSFNDQELGYFRDQYLLMHDPIDPSSSEVLQKFFEQEQFSSLKIGRLELDLLLFLHLTDRNLVVLGDVGWGKTTRLRYVYYYLFTQSLHLRGQYLPFYFSLDRHKNELQAAARQDRLKDVFYSMLIIPRLRKATAFHTSIRNEGFWSYLKSREEFSHLSIKESDLAYVHEGDPLELKKAVARERMQARSEPNFDLAVLDYLTKERGVTPVIIVDNSDQLDGEINAWILWELSSISGRYGAKTIMALRKSTFWRVFNSSNGLARTLQLTRSNIDAPDARIYTESKLALIKNRIEKRKISVTDEHGKRISAADVGEIYSSMIEIMLHPECQAFFASLAGGDLRRWARLLRIYFQTGYVNDHDLMWRVIGRSVESRERLESEYEVPLWVAISSILTNNHRTYFSQEPRDAEHDVVINLLCNGRGGPAMFLIRLHLLSIFSKRIKMDVKALRATYFTLFKGVDGEDFSRSFCHAIRRFVNCGVLSAPAVYRVEALEDVDRLDDLEITECGRYYMGRLLHYFEYLSFMKDDVDYPVGVTIRDCIQESQPSSRFGEVLKYVRFLHAEEEKFIKGLSRDGRRLYRENFAPARDMLFFAGSLCRSMVEFGKNRPSFGRHIGDYQKLLGEIEGGNSRFIFDLDRP